MLLFKKTHPIKGYIYAVVTGTYAGQLFVYVETNSENHAFLSLPEMVIRNVPIDKFDFGLKNRIIDVVERLPKNVYNLCIKQYRKNKTTA